MKKFRIVYQASWYVWADTEQEALEKFKDNHMDHRIENVEEYDPEWYEVEV